MRILGKSGSEIGVAALPSEDVGKGEYLLIEDLAQRRRMVVQVYDETYLDSPGLLEEIVRDEIIGHDGKVEDVDPLHVKSFGYLIRDLRLLKCKVRGSVEGNTLTPNVSWLPSRVSSRIRKVGTSELFALGGRIGHRLMDVGRTLGNEPYSISAEAIDGRLNIITGKKESGKSHLAKLLVSKLVVMGARILILDLNDEYGAIGFHKDGRPSDSIDRILRVEPGRSFKVSLSYTGLGPVVGVLQHVLDIPGVSLREFARIWEHLANQGLLSLKALGEAIQVWRCNEFVRDALFSRFHTLLFSRLFTDIEEEAVTLEGLFEKIRQGGAIQVSLARVPPLVRRMTVELILSKLVSLLERELIPPIFLFAEEAHLYLRETYWDDIITRMRHFGVFTTFITNQPDALKEGVYRQADNVFLFNFTNDLDLEMISRASRTDAETIKSIVRDLPPGCFLALGSMVFDLPMVVKVNPTDFPALGETRRFFKDPIHASVDGGAH